MSWSLAIKALFDALTAYLQLKAQSFYYDLIQKNRDKQLTLINEIEKLRSTGKPADADRADLLRLQVISEKHFAQHISDTNIATITGKQNSNT